MIVCQYFEQDEATPHYDMHAGEYLRQHFLDIRGSIGSQILSFAATNFFIETPDI